MSKKKPLSERQKNILQYIWEYVEENGRPPTIREISKSVKISSTSVVSYNLKRLTEKQLIQRDAEVSRGLRLTDKALELLGVVDETVKQVVDTVQAMVKIPLAGNIVAGEPIEVGSDTFSTYDDDDAIEIGASMLNSGRYDDLFALRVSGDSMIDAMVRDGDIVILKKQETARNGDMVAAWITGDDTTTLKYFYPEGPKVRLQPAHPHMDPIYVDADRLQIHGKVMMVMRDTA